MVDREAPAALIAPWARPGRRGSKMGSDARDDDTTPDWRDLNAALTNSERRPALEICGAQLANQFCFFSLASAGHALESFEVPSAPRVGFGWFTATLGGAC